jgi:hypothetical protein
MSGEPGSRAVVVGTRIGRFSAPAISTRSIYSNGFNRNRIYRL